MVTGTPARRHEAIDPTRLGALVILHNYEHHLGLEDIEPITIAAYIEELGAEIAKPSVKQHLAAIRQLFDYLVTGGVLVATPAGSVRGPKFVVTRGKTPVLSGAEMRQLLKSID